MTAFSRIVERCTVGRPLCYASAWQWLRCGVQRQALAAGVALVVTWTGLWLLVAASVAFTAVTTAVALIVSFVASIPPAPTGVVVFAGSLITTLVGTLWDLTTQLPVLLAALGFGTVTALAVFVVLIAAEPLLMRAHGYRRTSRRERERVLPLLHIAAVRLDVPNLPLLLMDDSGARSACTYTRHVVLSRRLYEELDDESLLALLTHELHHWVRGDAVGSQSVFAAGLPLILLYQSALRGRRAGPLLGLIAWTLLWPTWLLTRLVLQPLIARAGREQEYECDGATAAAGYGTALARGLSYLGDFEGGGASGWLELLARTHPPTELRLEALEDFAVHAHVPRRPTPRSCEARR